MTMKRFPKPCVRCRWHVLHGARSRPDYHECTAPGRASYNPITGKHTSQCISARPANGAECPDWTMPQLRWPFG